MKVGIIGASGMAGSAIYKLASQNKDLEVTGIVRDKDKAKRVLGKDAKLLIGDVLTMDDSLLQEFNVIVDAFGTTPERARDQVKLATKLCGLAKNKDIRVIFILGAGSLRTGIDNHLVVEDIKKLTGSENWINTPKEQLNELIKECDKKDLSEYTTSSKEIFEEALASAKTVYKKTNPTIKEIDDAMTALNDAIEQLVKPSQLEVELDNDLLVDDIDQFKLMIRNDVKAQAIIKEASDKGQKIVVKLAFVEQRQRARMRIENKLGIYSLKALLMVDDEEVYEFDNTNTLIKVTIDIPDQLLNDEVKSFYLVKNIEDEYPKVAFERNGNKITFNGQVGSQYSFIYEKKEDGVEEPSQDDNKPNHGNTNTQVDNNKQHSLFVNKVQTSDEYQSELYIVLLAAALIIPIILKKKEGITNEKESND
jgi:putative NADH-flavin reductase